MFLNFFVKIGPTSKNFLTMHDLRIVTSSYVFYARGVIVKFLLLDDE